MATPPKGMQRYKAWRRRYEPEVAELIIVAESPPISGLYLYNPDGSVSEPLFAALMKALGLSPTTKSCGLRALQQRGWVLVDATYEPVNGPRKSNRNAVIRRDYRLLRDDLVELTKGQPVPLVLIKANVCRLLEPRLVADGFHVLNDGRAVYFPSNGWQGHFQRQFADVLRSAEIE